MTQPTFHHFDHRSFLQTLDALELSKVVQNIAIELKGETCPMAGILTIHQDLVNLLNHFLRTNLLTRKEGQRGSTERSEVNFT